MHQPVAINTLVYDPMPLFTFLALLPQRVYFFKMLTFICGKICARRNNELVNCFQQLIWFSLILNYIVYTGLYTLATPTAAK